MSITLMDGGMGREIARRLDGAGHGLWSAKALVEAPQIVLDIHQEYIAAGAAMILTNTYATVPHYLAKEGLADEYLSYTRLAGELARQAVQESTGVPDNVQVAGALPPLNESYRADLVPPAAEAEPVYRAMVETLLPYVDLYICETMSSAEEAFVAAQQAVLLGEGKPVFVAWTLNEQPGAGLRSGESLTEAFERVAALDLSGFMLNCTSPEAIEAGLPELLALTDKPIGCYANRLDKVPEGWTLDNTLSAGQRTDLTTDYFVAMSQRFVAAGGSMVGGCCGIGPDDIAALKHALDARPAPQNP